MTGLHFEVGQDWQLSANHRMHWAQFARRVAYLRNLGNLTAQSELPLGTRLPKYKRAHLTVRVGWPTKHRRDVANISPTIKALVDGIVDAGLLPDDDDAHLVGPDLRPYCAGKKGVVVLDFDFEELP